MVSINSKKPPSEWDWGQIEYYRKAFENYDKPADKEWSEGLLLQTEADREYHSPNLRRGFQIMLEPIYYYKNYTLLLVMSKNYWRQFVYFLYQTAQILQIKQVLLQELSSMKTYLRQMKGLEHVDEKPNYNLKEAKCEIYKISLTLPPTGYLYCIKIYSTVLLVL